MASMRDIKRRKVSIQSTQQITKAMKLVSTVRLQRAKGRAERSQAYFKCMYKTVSSMLSKSGNLNHPFLKKGVSDQKAVIVITSNRGLAGGFNSNIIKLVTHHENQDECNASKLHIYAVGTKGRDALRRHGYSIVSDRSEIIEEPMYTDAAEIAEMVLKAFTDGEVGEIYLAYTGFKNTVTHISTLMKILPVETSGQEEVDSSVESKSPMNYEPTEDEALNLIIPKYVTSLIYGGLVESVASENGARMQAMDSATSNAEEMIGHLELQYNRARQGSITQELTEIIAGAEAIS